MFSKWISLWWQNLPSNAQLRSIGILKLWQRENLLTVPHWISFVYLVEGNLETISKQSSCQASLLYFSIDAPRLNMLKCLHLCLKLNRKDLMNSTLGWTGWLNILLCGFQWKITFYCGQSRRVLVNSHEEHKREKSKQNGIILVEVLVPRLNAVLSAILGHRFTEICTKTSPMGNLWLSPIFKSFLVLCSHLWHSYRQKT